MTGAAPQSLAAPAAASTAADGPPRPLARRVSAPDPSALLPVGTLVLWLGCLVVGGLGLILSYRQPLPPPKPVPPVIVEQLQVELTNDPLPPLEPDAAPPDPAAPPPLIQPVTMPKAPPLMAVAEPSPAIAFALPVEAPARVVEAKQASYSRAPVQTENATPAVAPQQLTYGQGEGRQPAPEYPRRAVREGQEGTVGVRFSVGENGRVLAAEISRPSPWALLNDAAVRVIRERWRFRSGSHRSYEVAIRFELQK